jgi:hypothetical protein
MIAPVVGSGCKPACIALVPNFICIKFNVIFTFLKEVNLIKFADYKIELEWICLD